jgi:hypothetical protein
MMVLRKMPHPEAPPSVAANPRPPQWVMHGNKGAVLLVPGK